MWCPVGYRRFDEVVSSLFELLHEVYRDALVVEFFGPMGQGDPTFREAFDAFVLSCPSLSVCSPDGFILRVSPKIMQRRQCQNSLFGLMFVDAETWTVKLQEIPTIALGYASAIKEGRVEYNTGHFDSDSNEWIPGTADEEITDLIDAVDDRRFHSLFQRFVGWSIVCLEQDSPGNSTPTDQMLDYFASSSDLSLPEIVRRIVADYDANGQVVRDDAHMKYCPDMKRDAFRAVWSLAANQRPELSRRGPKRAKIKN